MTRIVKRYLCIKDYMPSVWLTKGKIYELDEDDNMIFDDGYEDWTDVEIQQFYGGTPLSDCLQEITDENEESKIMTVQQDFENAVGCALAKQQVKKQFRKINCKFEGDELPKYERQGDSAMDLKAWKFHEVSGGKLLPVQDFTEEGYVLQPFDRILVPTGLKLELPEDIDADVRPRSGLTLKSGIMVALGTIDSPYTGDVGMIVMNLSKEEFLIKRGDRLGQLKFAIPVEVELNRVDEIHTTNRGEAGFGSSGI